MTFSVAFSFASLSIPDLPHTVCSVLWLVGSSWDPGSSSSTLFNLRSTSSLLSMSTCVFHFSKSTLIIGMHPRIRCIVYDFATPENAIVRLFTKWVERCCIKMLHQMCVKWTINQISEHLNISWKIHIHIHRRYFKMTVIYNPIEIETLAFCSSTLDRCERKMRFLSKQFCNMAESFVTTL